MQNKEASSRLLSSAMASATYIERRGVTFTLAESVEGFHNPGLTPGVKSCGYCANAKARIKSADLNFRNWGSHGDVAIAIANGENRWLSVIIHTPDSGTTLHGSREIAEGDFLTLTVLGCSPGMEDGILFLELE